MQQNYCKKEVPSDKWINAYLKNHEKSLINNPMIYLKEQEKEQQMKPRVSRRKLLLVVVGNKRLEHKYMEWDQKGKINETKSWFFF